MNFGLIKDIAVLVGSFVALFTLIKGVLEYSKNNSMKRAEYFSQLQQELYKLIESTKIGEMLENDSREINNLTYHDKLKFLGFYEKVALMLESKLIRKEIAHYMFSYHAILCYNNKMFWTNMERDSPYWKLFCDFAKEMESVQKSVGINGLDQKKLKF